MVFIGHPDQRCRNEVPVFSATTALIRSSSTVIESGGRTKYTQSGQNIPKQNTPEKYNQTKYSLRKYIRKSISRQNIFGQNTFIQNISGQNIC